MLRFLLSATPEDFTDHWSKGHASDRAPSQHRLIMLHVPMGNSEAVRSCSTVAFPSMDRATCPLSRLALGMKSENRRQPCNENHLTLSTFTLSTFNPFQGPLLLLQSKPNSRRFMNKLGLKIFSFLLFYFQAVGSQTTQREVILQKRREIANAVNLATELSNGEVWLRAGFVFGVVEKVELSSPSMAGGRDPGMKTVTIRLLQNGGSFIKTLDGKQAFRLPKDWEDAANQRSNLTSVTYDPFHEGAAFAVKLHDGESTPVVDELFPVPKRWFEDSETVRKDMLEFYKFFGKASLSAAGIILLEQARAMSGEFFRCVVYSKLMNSGTWDAERLAQETLKSTSVEEIAVNTCLCLRSTSALGKTALDQLSKLVGTRDEAVLGVAYACYIALKTGDPEVRKDLQLYGNLAPFNLKENDDLLSRIRTGLMTKPVVRLMLSLKDIKCSLSTRNTVDALLDASDILALVKQKG